MPTVNIENISTTRKRLVVPVAAEDVKKAETEVIRGVMAEANVPGFRPGKAPEAMVRTRYATVINDELQRRVVRQSYEKALKDAKLDLCAVVDVEGEPVAVGRNTVVTVTVDVYPTFQLPEYKGLTVKLPRSEVTDKDVDSTIDLIRGQRAEFAAADRPAAAGDYVRLSYHGTLGGRAIAEIAPEKPIYGTQKSTWEEAGSHDYGIKAVTEGLVGMSKGDKKTVSMTFAKDLDVPALAGQTASYDIEVLEVREKKMPALDETFFKAIGTTDLATLKQQVRESLEARAKDENEGQKRHQLSDALIAGLAIELPESLVQGESQQIIQELIEENQKRGVTDAMLKENESKLIEAAKTSATNRVKLRMVLRQIAHEEKIEITENDFQKWVMNEAMSRQTTPDKIVKDLNNDRERASNLAQALRLGKAMQIVVDSAKVEETEAKKK